MTSLRFVNHPLEEEYHSHTSDWSDGKNTLEEMRAKAKALKLKRLMITDHCTTDSTSLYCKGRTGNRRNPEDRNISDLELGFGVEADILDEEGGIRQDIQGVRFGFNILSLHGSTYVGDPTKVTDGMINAMIRHNINLIGHPYDFHLGKMDVKRIVACANAHRIGVEFNCKSVLNGNADMEGVMTVLNEANRLYFTTDAHSTDNLETYRRDGLTFLREEGFSLIYDGGLI